MGHTLNMNVEPDGIRGLNRLAIRLTDLVQANVIASWQLGRCRQQHSVHFESTKDAGLAEADLVARRL
jgi:hypothetical protein